MHFPKWTTFILILSAFCSNIKAQSLDTFTVTTHNKVLIQTDPSRGSTDYRGWGVFPRNKNFQRMYCELSFQCPTGMTCGEWDYLNYIYLDNRRGTFNDSLGWEIMRFITPYGLTFNSQWKHTWRFDITDFQSLFKDSVQIKYRHTGYEARNGRGWIITVKFIMHEGPSIRDVIGIQRMMQKSIPYGNDSLFEARSEEFSWTPNEATKYSRFKIIQTGHGMDQPSNCAEFCPKRRYLWLDSQYVDTSWVWREDCGSNPVFPQGGTWVYDRASWCPGQNVEEYNFEVKENGKPHTFDLDMETYVRTGGSSNYVITNYLVEYGEYRYSTDATIEDILKPSNHPQYSRMNPICSEPQVRIKNTGKEVIQSLELEYGISGGKLEKYLWKGVIHSNQTFDVYLPSYFDWTSVSNKFECRILKVNGKSDEDASNNFYQVETPAIPPALPNKVIVVFKTNNAPSENSYRIIGPQGNIVHQKTGFTAKNTIHRDTITLGNGCFTFEFSDTGVSPQDYLLNEDGLGWWANTYDGNGSLQLRNGVSGVLHKNFGIDFGTSIRYDFTVGFPASAADLEKPNSLLKVFPNPASEGFAVEIPELFAKNATPAIIEIRNLQGQLIESKILEPNFSVYQWIDLKNRQPGVYMVNFKQNNDLCTSKVVLY